MSWLPWFRRKSPAVTEVIRPAEKPRQAMKISPTLLGTAMVKPGEAQQRKIEPYVPPIGVVPDSERKAVLAMDRSPYQLVNQIAGFEHLQFFPGYPYLAQLAMQPEYRKMVGTLAEEMTRKWISLRSVGDDDKTERMQAIEAELERLNVRQVFRQAAEHDGYFGRGQIYIEVKKPDGGLASADPVEMETPLFISDKKLPLGGLVGLKAIEPVWTYPCTYNADNPLAADFYAPDAWFVMAKKVHVSRLLTLVSRPVPDMLKAAYNFGGLSLSQIAEPYIRNWLRTRDSVGDLVHAFSLTILKTNMAATLAGSADPGLFERIQVFNLLRDNRGVLAVDKDDEELEQINTPLSGLDALQAQAQEQMSSISSIPLVKLLGVTPSGLNASSDGEIRVFYDDINARQENLFRKPLKRVMDLVQLSLFGDIDPEINFVFDPLFQLSETELATVRKTEADTDAVLITAGVISTDDVRQRIASDPDSPYHGLELNEVPDEPEPDDDGEEEAGAGGNAEAGPA